MKAQNLTAKVLEVTAKTCYDESHNDGEEYTFEVYEFDNGLILVPGESTNDWFFESSDDIQASGNDEIVSVNELSRTSDFTPKELLQSIQGSMREFGIESVPAIHAELWRK